MRSWPLSKGLKEVQEEDMPVSRGRVSQEEETEQRLKAGTYLVCPQKQQGGQWDEVSKEGGRSEGAGADCMSFQGHCKDFGFYFQ